MEAGTDFEERGEGTANFGGASCGAEDAGEDFEQHRLPCPVATEEANDGAARDFEAHVL